MKVILVALVFLLLPGGCKPKYSGMEDQWMVIDGPSGSQVFRPGSLIGFTPDSVRWSFRDEKGSCPVIKNSNRLLISQGSYKWLFELEVDGNEMILRELYEQKPQIIRLIRQVRSPAGN